MMFTLTELFIMGVYFLTLYFSIFWLLVMLEKEDITEKTSLKHHPMFTVIIPAFNEEDSVAATIDSAAKLDYPKDKIEIIVVNDGSTDYTRKIVEEYIKIHEGTPKVKLINQDNKGKGSALNKGLKEAKGEFFACLDADSFVEPDALIIMLPLFDSEEVGSVCPLMKIKDPKNMIQRMQWYEYIINFFYKKLNAKLDCVHVTPGPFSVYRTKVINGLGGYDENNITEDLEIAIRLQKHNYKIVQTLDATVYTIAPDNLKTLFKQRNRWYKGSVYNTLKYKDLMFNRKYGDFGMIRMPTILVSGILAIAIFALLLKTVIELAYKGIINLAAVNFDLMTIASNMAFHIDLLSIDFTAAALFIFVITLGLFVLVYSHKAVGEKIFNHSKAFVSLSCYMLAYSFFITLVWIAIGFEMAAGKKQKW